MYFVKYQPLKRKLKKRTLSDREAVVYLVVYSFLLGLAFAFLTGTSLPKISNNSMIPVS